MTAIYTKIMGRLNTRQQNLKYNQSIIHFKKPSIHQSINPPNNQSIHPSIHQSIAGHVVQSIRNKKKPASVKPVFKIFEVKNRK